ncbi:glycosyltransferase [Candidatus Symbiobacter mobilis CR]|uniref:Glycosyltransferase n=2 Tax=Candidatus Symbiobacter TaxID=1436289 RepID=U5ND93_9BURK|nr:glycosyltransferase [Candidatus Symbiobacter mobilis CR]
MAVLMPSEFSCPVSTDNTENELIVTPKVPSTIQFTQVTRNGILFELDLSETIERSIYDIGCFEPATTAAIAKLVKSGMTVIDIGANIGAHALFMAQLVGLTGRAFAIEPMSEAFRKLSRNLELNPLLANLSLHRVALGSENGSLLANFNYSWPLDGNYRDVIPESVPVRCLDDFLDEQGITRVDLIKLDVDGFEHKILRGASRTLREMRPILVMELCNYTLESVGDSAATMLEEIVACRYCFFFEQDFRPATPSELLEAIPVGSSINVIAMPEKIPAQATSDYCKKANGQKPRIMLMADIPNWIFARHCQVLIQLLGNEFDFDLKFHGQSYNEDDYDLLYPLEWNLIPSSQIRTPAKYVTSIRSHTSWAGQDFLGFVNYLSCQFQRIHTVSKRLTNIFSPFVPNTAYVTHGTDTSFFVSSTHADFSGAGKIRIGWAGNRVNKTKGFDELIVPLGHIPGVELVICGYMDNHLDLVEMRNFYNTIDVYVCTSHQEGNNNSLMEAAAMERAIITTDNGTVPEYLRSGYSAVIVERELPVLIRAVCTLRDDPNLRVELGRHARAAVVANFDWNVMAQKYANFFHDALQAASTWKPAIGAVEAAVASKHAVSNVSGIDVFTLISAAERYIEEMRTDEAIGLYQTWLDNNISSPLAYAVLFNLGVCQINSGYKQIAVVNLNHALKLNPNFILAKKAIESLA